MKPYEERTVDGQYKRLLNDIIENGVRAKSQQGVDAITLIGPNPLRFKMDNGFPMITERNMSPKVSENLPVTIWQQAIGEIFAFINGARTVEELEKFGCYWWKAWGTPEKCEKRGLSPGDLGPGSYGAAFHDFPTTDMTLMPMDLLSFKLQSRTFNQFQHLVEQIKEFPHLRTHFVSPWIPQYIGRGKGKQQKVVVAPCHGWIHVRVIDGKMTLHMFQRSADVPVGVPSNMVQYAALLLALAHVTGFEPYEYIHSFSDTQIYVDQIDAVKTMLDRGSLNFPTVSLRNPPNDLFSFRKEHFVLSDYTSHPGIKAIPVAI